MKILTNTSSTSYGGIARRAIEMFSDSKSRQNIEIVVLAIGREKRDFPDNSIIKYNIELPESIPKNVCGNLNSYDELCNRFEPVVRTVEDIINIEKPDVAFIEGTYYAPWCFYRAAKRVRMPIVLLYAGILREEIANWSKTQKEPLMKMERDFYSLNTHYIFPSNLTKRKVETEVFKASLPQSSVIPNGISPEFFINKLVEEGEGKGEGIGWIGRSSYVKRLDYILQLNNELRKSCKSYKIHIVTDTQPKLRAELENAGIEVISPMESSKLREFYQRREVIISPSHFETYGNVPMEAIAAGTPALVSLNMGVAERFIELGLEDYITDFDNIPATVEKIEHVRLMHFPREFKERLKNYLWSAIFDRYYTTCQQAIG